MWSGSVIIWDGKAVPSFFDKDAFLSDTNGFNILFKYQLLSLEIT